MPTSPIKIPEERAWMKAMMRRPGFRRLPAEQIRDLFQRMHDVPVRAGQIVFRQGEIGTDYYVIKSGTATVSRWDGRCEQEVARLDETAAFGEEALVSDCPRSATITMDSDGILKRLGRDDFEDLLLQSHLVTRIDLRESRRLVAEGAVRIDVRPGAEFARTGLPGAINLPLHELRERLHELRSGTTYILYCDTGKRSAAAAFLIALRGYDARVLSGGLLNAVQ